MMSEEILRLARRIIDGARIQARAEIEFDQVLQDLRCTFTRGGDVITIVVLQEFETICCYQYSPTRWRQPTEQHRFLAFSRQIGALQDSLERRLNTARVRRLSASRGSR